MDITFEEESDSPRTERAIDEMKAITGDKGCYVGMAVQNKSLIETTAREMGRILVVAVLMILAVLCLATTAWTEPILFMMVMGVAVLLNKGTNIFLGTISFLTDNVAIIVNDNGLKAGTRFPDGLTLIEHIPQGHKVALVDIPAHGEIVRYGEVIGYAVRAIPQGSWIEESLVELPKAPPLNTLPLATRVPEPLPPLEDYTFEGYRNPDGSVGTKNLLGLTTSVHCVAGVVDYVVKIIERDLLPKYPNVDGVVGLNHLYGCGVAINAPAAVVPIRTIHNIALNPNFWRRGDGDWSGVRKNSSLSVCSRVPKTSKPFRQTRPALYACRTNATLGSGLWSTIFCRLPSVISISSTDANAKPAPSLTWWWEPVRRQRCVLWRDGQPGGGLCVRPACSLRCDSDVLRSD